MVNKYKRNNRLALRLCEGLLLYTHTYKCNIIKLNSNGGTFMYVVNTIEIS